MSEIPMIKKAVLTERLTVPVDKKLKEALSKLKDEKGVNVPELVRIAIREKLDQMKAG
jgi:hypothetical protein